MAKPSVMLYTLNVGDKFTTTKDPNKVFEIVDRKGDTTYTKEVATGKTGWFEYPDSFVIKVDESATYQKKRFLDPVNLEEAVKSAVKKVTESVRISNEDDLYYWMVDYMEKNKGKGSTSLQFITNNGNNIIISWNMKQYNGISIDGQKMNMGEFCHHRMKGVGIQDILEVDMNTGRFKPVKESLSSRSHTFKPEELKVGKKVIDNGVKGTIMINHNDLYKDNKYRPEMKGSTRITVKRDDNGRSYDVDANDSGGEFILEGRIAKGYENLDADEKARHLLSHPSSKYMSDLKSENITERAIRKAVKEMLGKPDKDDPQFITDVNEEGEAPAATTSTANVANPELPLKLKESVLPTENEGWGFFGTSLNYVDGTPKAEQFWEIASKVLAKERHWNPKQVRDWLDSKSGRHFADTVSDFGWSEGGIRSAYNKWDSMGWFDK